MKERRGTLSASLAVVNKEFNIIYEIFTFRNQECSLSLRYRTSNRRLLTQHKNLK